MTPSEIDFADYSECHRFEYGGISCGGIEKVDQYGLHLYPRNLHTHTYLPESFSLLTVISMVINFVINIFIIIVFNGIISRIYYQFY